jgi:hypothetical protein
MMKRRKAFVGRMDGWRSSGYVRAAKPTRAAIYWKVAKRAAASDEGGNGRERPRASFVQASSAISSVFGAAAPTATFPGRSEPCMPCHAHAVTIDGGGFSRGCVGWGRVVPLGLVGLVFYYL